MKKLFFYAMMAVGMTAACQKPDVTDETDVLDDNSPVEVVFGVNAPSITVTKTKAAVENWAGEPEVFIFSGLIDGQSTKFDEPLINDAKAKVSGNNTGATVTFAGTNDDYTTNPKKYYYEVDKVYDFYGYYIDDATAENTVVQTDKITKVITIDGSQDIMLASTDKAVDLNEATAKVNQDKIYSAYAARRGVQPTLVFEHMLSRFTFKAVRGETANSNTANVRITKLGLYGKTKGTLTIAPTQSFTANTDDTEKLIVNDAATVDPTDGTPIDCGSDLMVFPGASEIVLELELTPEDPTLATHKQIVKVPLKAETITEGKSSIFEAGKQYNVTITIYDLEQIVVTANLTEWGVGGDVVYDSDEEADNDVTMYNTPTTEGVLFHFVETLSVGSRVYADKDMTSPMANGVYTDTANKVVYEVTDGTVESATPYFITETSTAKLYHKTEVLSEGDDVYKTPAEIAGASTVEDGKYIIENVCFYEIHTCKVMAIYYNAVVNTSTTVYYRGEEIAVGTILYKDTNPNTLENGFYTTATNVYKVENSGEITVLYYITSATKDSSPVTLYHTAEVLDLGVRVCTGYNPTEVYTAGDYVIAGKTYTVNENGWIEDIK